ncbi:MAG: 16S rRNA (cytosine(1402)-N(4))-methyltransferase [Desulfobulbus sp.]|nr:MAG: 16S rRNA (cytosine(1402)-N(4))-methyltransferase [Desulfobulbus sp.]
MAGGSPHIPVLPCEVLEWLAPRADGLYIDATLGLGGHSSLILERSAPSGRVIGFEWDNQAVAQASSRLSVYGERFQLVHGSYADVVEHCHDLDLPLANGVLLDLGVSSLQLDTPERGFSFRSEAPLDMRMGTSLKVTAADLVNRLKKDELADVFYNYGEERQARRIARFLVEARLEKPVTTTKQLADIVSRAIPRKYHPKKIHVATKVFQGLRIAVNSELDNLVKLLNDAPQIMSAEGRLAVITFHSLEDRIVKQAFVNNPDYRVLTKRPVLPGKAETENNPRSRSAKLRVAERR